MLAVLAMFYGLAVVSMIFQAYIPGQQLDASVKWVFLVSGAVSAFVVALVVCTLIFRARSRSDACLIWTKAFNIFLLLVFPFGTIVGIYGLLRVDRVRKSTQK